MRPLHLSTDKHFCLSYIWFQGEHIGSPLQLIFFLSAKYKSIDKSIWHCVFSFVLGGLEKKLKTKTLEVGMAKFPQKFKALLVWGMLFSFLQVLLPELISAQTILKEKEKPSFKNVPQEEYRHYDAYILLGLGLGSAGLSYSYHHKAENFYDSYEKAVTQLEMESNYSQYKKNHWLGNITAVVSLAFLGGAVYLLVKKDKTAQRHQNNFGSFPLKLDWHKERIGLVYSLNF
jgi:hypothetical protein